MTEAATYTRPGKGVETCSRCGETRDTVIEAVAYTADATVEAGDSIQDAIDAADAGDVIVVEAGTYAEQLVIGKDVTIIGEGEVVIAGRPIIRRSSLPISWPSTRSAFRGTARWCSSRTRTSRWKT